MDLCALPNHELTNVDASKKASMVKQLHERVKQALERKAEHTTHINNKNRKRVVFEPGDWVWLHFRKERFPDLRKSKLHPRGDGPFQVLARINDNAYKLDLPSEFNVHATFNVSDLSPFNVGDDLRANQSEGGGDDEDIPRDTTYRGGGALDGLHLPSGPITRSRMKQFKQSLSTFFNNESGIEPSPTPKRAYSYFNMITWNQVEQANEAPRP